MPRAKQASHAPLAHSLSPNHTNQTSLPEQEAPSFWPRLGMVPTTRAGFGVCAVSEFSAMSVSTVSRELAEESTWNMHFLAHGCASTFIWGPAALLL